MVKSLIGVLLVSKSPITVHFICLVGQAFFFQIILSHSPKFGYILQIDVKYTCKSLVTCNVTKSCKVNDFLNYKEKEKTFSSA